MRETFRGLRLLIVEDNAPLRENLAEIFREEGYQVAEATDGAAARTLAEDGFDIAIVDVRLPDTTGTKLAPQLTRWAPDAEVIIATANADVSTAIEAVQAGAFAYLTKPVRIEELLLTISRASERIELRRKSAQLQTALEASEHRLRTIVENVGALILTIDDVGVVQFASRAAHALLGWEPADLIGRSMLDTLPAANHRDDCARALNILEDGGEATMEVDCKHRDGSLRRQQWRWTRTREGGGLRYGIGTDVSQQRDLERRAQRAEKLAAAGTLTAGLAHEIRNPLNAANLQLSVLSRYFRRLTEEQSEPMQQTVDLVQDELKRLDVLLEDFLAFARPRRLSVERVDVDKLVREAVTLEQPVAEADGCIFTAELETGLRVEVDRHAIHQVLINLIKNALEAARSEVEVTLGKRGEEAVIRIMDDGPGIPQEIHDRIFEPFFTTKPEGTGLGMAIAHTLIDQHQGQLTIGERAGGGTIMQVVLPLL